MNEHSTLSAGCPSVTFAVHDVERRSQCLHRRPLHEHIKKILGGNIESCSDYHTAVCSRVEYQPLLAAVYTAYSLHYPLALTPDAVWLTIAQGVAHHMALNGEQLRDRLVAHEGRLELGFKTDDWVARSPENPWADAFDAWTDQIRKHVGDALHSALICDFSTTTAIARAASQIVMMDIFEKYFRYTLIAVCGIPEITLRGTTDDWRRLSDKVDSLEPFGMSWWLDHLRPIVGQFARASQGDIDAHHWRNICKLEDAYGGHVINGWVAELFPYLRERHDGPCTRRNPIFETGEGFQTSAAPSGLSQVPFLWKDLTSGDERMMEAIGGLVGVIQEQDSLAVEPIAGWAIREASELDVLLARVKIDHETTPHPRVDADLEKAVANDGMLVARDVLPADLAQFYHEFERARLFVRDGDSLVQILGRNEIASVDWGETADDFSCRGPDGRTWYRFAVLQNDQYLAINLDVNLHLVVDDEEDRREVFFGSFHPICVYSETTRGIDGKNPVIALSFTELLSRLLNESNVTRLYWQSLDFEAHADAGRFTRRTSLDDYLADRKRRKKK